MSAAERIDPGEDGRGSRTSERERLANGAPEVTLWRAVLAQAASDALGIGMQASSASVREHLLRSAVAWRRSADAGLVADLAGVELGAFDRAVDYSREELAAGRPGHVVARLLERYLQRL